MRYAVIIAGGSGTRLWPMSRAALPKQLIPFVGGRSLLEIAVERLDGLLPAERRYICAGQSHAAAIGHALPQIGPEQFLGEPCGRDTLNAVGFSAAILARRDPEATIGVFTADHIIEPVEQFRAIVAAGYELVERHPEALLTFGITPTGPAVGFGYLELGEPFDVGWARPTGIVNQHQRDEIGGPCPPYGAQRLRQFREKPDFETAKAFVAAGAERFLWNSGMYVWRAATLLDCIRRYEPETHAGLMQIADAWETPRRQEVLDSVYPTLKKISVDYAVMEPASRSADVPIVALPMPLTWLDVGSWPSFAQTCPRDESGNANTGRAVFLDSHNTLAASSDPAHLIAAIGCEDLLIIHTPDATLVCPADRADAVKAMHEQVAKQFGKEIV